MKLLPVLSVVLCFAGCQTPPDHENRVNNQWQASVEPRERSGEDDEINNRPDNSSNLAKQKKEYLEQHKNLSPLIRDGLTHGNLTLGMSKDEVMLIRGFPDDVSSFVSELGKAETYHYGRLLVYFVNGKLTAWSN